jgi:Sen15 protein
METGQDVHFELPIEDVVANIAVDPICAHYSKSNEFLDAVKNCRKKKTFVTSGELCPVENPLTTLGWVEVKLSLSAQREMSKYFHKFQLDFHGLLLGPGKWKPPQMTQIPTKDHLQF